jgi:hypothetical protein
MKNICGFAYLCCGTRGTCPQTRYGCYRSKREGAEEKADRVDADCPFNRPSARVYFSRSRRSQWVVLIGQTSNRRGSVMMKVQAEFSTGEGKKSTFVHLSNGRIYTRAQLEAALRKKRTGIASMTRRTNRRAKRRCRTSAATGTSTRTTCGSTCRRWRH